MKDKKNILQLNYIDLEAQCLALGLKKFNVKQIYSWLHQKNVSSFDEMSNISKPHRALLNEEFYIPEMKILEHQVSKIDRTEKFLFELKDGKMIETVLMRHGDRNTVCVSSQVGCAVKCSFCATGINGFKRNLSFDEILSQIYYIQRALSKEGETVRNVVFMGMGEPLLNLDNVMDTIKILISEEGLNLSKRRITISTSGIIPQIQRLIDEDLTVELALSLHASSDEIRKEIIPINDKYPIKDLMEVLKKYQAKSNRKITFEYILIDHLNDSKEDGDKLKDLVEGFEYVINIIPYNPVEGLPHSRPSRNRIFNFFNYLKNDLRLNATLRGEKGTDIDGACGQLRQKQKNVELDLINGNIEEKLIIKNEK